MASQATVRHATEEDVSTILQLINELAAYEKVSHEVLATPETLLATLSFPSNPQRGYAKTFLIIDPNGHCAGMALYFNNYSTWRASPGIYLEDLFIRPAYRKRGYGKRLLGELARETLAIGGKRLEWSVLKWNKPSLDFYESLGAVRMEEWVGMRVERDALDKLSELGRRV